LRPGQDVKAELDGLAVERQWEAACVLTCAGSLTRAALRFANREETTVMVGHFEIVALTGTLSMHGSHLHIAIADGDGRVFGAHLMDGNCIYTTAEIVLGIVPGVSFRRIFDPQTGYPELEIVDH
jgi:predicted DNA-binding protein with PD1-like motif